MTAIHNRRRASLAMLAGGAVSFLVAGAIAAAPAIGDPGNGNSGSPPGNNGTVKVGDGIGNDPHVTCPFDVSFFNFDASATASVAFFSQPPSGSGGSVAFSGGPASLKLDASGDGVARGYTLNTTGLTEQRNQGFHVRLEVSVTNAAKVNSTNAAGDNGQGKNQGKGNDANAPGKGKGVVTAAGDNGQGKDNGNGPADKSVTVKTKVFWYKCAVTPVVTPTSTPTGKPTSEAPVPPTGKPTSEAPVPPTGKPTSEAPVPPTGKPTPPTEKPAPPAPPTTQAAPKPAKTVIGEKVTPPTPTPQLPFTGVPTGLLVSTALGFILTGAGLLGLIRRTPVAARR